MRLLSVLQFHTMLSFAQWQSWRTTHSFCSPVKWSPTSWRLVPCTCGIWNISVTILVSSEIQSMCWYGVMICLVQLTAPSSTRNILQLSLKHFIKTYYYKKQIQSLNISELVCTKEKKDTVSQYYDLLSEKRSNNYEKKKWYIGYQDLVNMRSEVM